MKKLLFFTFLFIAFQVKAQITGTYQIKGADTVKMWKAGGSINPNATELILMNNTDTVPGFLWNRGNGVTIFKRPLTKINSTTYLVGVDTLYIGAGGGGSPGGNSMDVQLNYSGAFTGVPSFFYDTTNKVLVAAGFFNTVNTATNSLVIGQNNIVSGPYNSAIGFGNTTSNYGYAFGIGNNVNGYSISVGNGNIKTNAYSSTFGNNLINTYQNALVIGAFNDTTSWPNASVAGNTNLYPVFSIGNGQNNSLRKNVFTILHNGGVIFNLQNNSTLDSALQVDQNGNLTQYKKTSGGGGGGTLDSVGLTMPTGLIVSGSPVTGTGGHISVTTSLNGVVHAGGGALTGSHIVDADVNDVSWSKITTPPNSILGYGITDNLVNTVNGRKGDVITKNADSIKGLPIDTSVRRNGYVLSFDSIAHNWYLAINGTGGGATTFSGLSDVNVTSPINNQFSVYNSGTNKWTNLIPTTTLIPEGVNLYWTSARFDTRFNTKSTDSLPEGTNNLYFTNTRVRNAVSGASPLAYSSTTGVMSIQNAKADATTKGAPTFSASDFNDDGAGLISVDYVNGQVATNSVNGFLSSADHTAFSGKLPANPTAGIGFTPVNGSAVTYIRSDAAQKIDTNSVDIRYNINTTISAIRTMTSPLTGVKYHITGNSQDGDFVYDPLDVSSADNTGTILVDAAGHRLKRVITGSIVYADWFGLPKDGVTFDSARVQMSVDYAGSVGKSLQFSNGTLVMRNLNLNYDNFSLLLSPGTILKAPVTDTTANAAIINCIGRKNILISGGTFDGTLMKGSQAGGNPVLRFSVDTNLIVRNFTIDSNSYTGVSVQNYCYNVDISGFNIFNTDVGIHFIGNGTGSSKIRIHDGLISGGTSEGMTFQGSGGIPPSASNDILISHVHVTGKANSSGVYFLYAYNVIMANSEIDHCRAGIGGIPMANRPDMTHNITLSNIQIHDMQNDGIGNQGSNFTANNLTFDNIGREAIAVGNTLDTLHIDSNVNISNIRATNVNTGHSANWGILRIQNCYKCTFDHIVGTLGTNNDTTTGVFAINFIGNADSLVTVSNCTFTDGQILTRFNKTDNYIVFKDNFTKSINLSWAVSDSLTQKAVYLNNTYSGNPAKGISTNANGFATGINSSNPQINYLAGSNIHMRSLQGTFIGRKVRIVSTANGNTVIHTKTGAAGNMHLKYGQDAQIDSAKYVQLEWDGAWWNQTDGNTKIEYWPVGADTVTVDSSGAKVKVYIASGRIALNLGANDQTDDRSDTNTAKSFRITMPRYDDPKRLIGVMAGSSNATVNTLQLGAISPNFYYNFQNIDFHVAPYGAIGLNPVMRLSYPDNALHIGSPNFTAPLNVSIRQTYNDASGNAYTVWTRGKHYSPSGSTETYSGLWINDTINNVGNGLSSGVHINPSITLATGGYAGTWYDYNSGWNVYSPSTSVMGWMAGGLNMGAGNSAGHASAQLDGNGTDKTKGWLPNVLTSAQMNAIVSPAAGLFVICSDSGYAICGYNGTAWLKLGSGGLINLYSKNSAIAISGDTVQAQNLAFVDPKSNGVLGVLYDSLSWNSPLGYLQQSGSGVTVASSQIQLVEADNNGTVYVRLPTNTCLDQQTLSANFVIKATNAGDSGAMVSLVSVNTHSVSSLFARLNTTTRKVELLSNQNGSTTIITSAATLPTSITTGDSLTIQLINNNQAITAQATDRTTANTISVSFSNTFAYAAPLFIANTGQVTFNSGNGTYQLNRLTYSSNLPKNQRLGVVGYSITQGYAAGSIAGTWSRAIGGVVSAGSADYTASILLPGRLQEMHALGMRNWIIGGLAGNDIPFGISSGVWQANLINIYDSIISWGSNCYFTLETPRNSVDITPANTFIKATFPNLYIDLFTPLWSGTSYTMNPIYNTGDGTHPNTAGHLAMANGAEQSFVYNLIQNGAQIPIVTPIIPGAATTVQVSTGAGLAGYSEFFYNHALTQLYSPLIAGSATTGQGLMFHSNSAAGNGTISFGSTTTGMNYQENNASLAIGTSAVTSGTKLDVRGGGLRVGTTNAGMILPDYAGSGPATAGSVLFSCSACGSGQGLVLDANSNAGTSGAFVKAVSYNGSSLRTVWEYSNTTGGAVPTLKIMDSSGFVRFGATSADTLSSAGRGSYTTNLGSTFTPYSWIDYNSADSLAKKRAHDSAVAYAGGGGNPFSDNAALVKNNADNTKLLILNAGSITTGTTRTATFPDANITVADKLTGLQQFASTTSSQLAGVISDETGTGSLVFGTSPSITTPLLTGLTSSGPNDSIVTVDPTTGQTHRRSGILNLTFAGGLHPAPTLDSVLWGGTLNQAVSVVTAGNPISFTGSGNVSFTTGNTTFNGPVIYSQGAPGDANFTITTQSQLTLKTTLTANRTLTLPSVSTFQGRTLIISNYNPVNNTNLWITSPGVLDPTGTGTVFASLVNGATYTLYSDGSSWIMQSVQLPQLSTIIGNTASISTGTSSTISNGITNVLLDPASLITTYTFTMPSNPNDGQIIKIHFGGTITSGNPVVTTLTISPNSGQGFLQSAAPTTATAGACIIYEYNISNSKWYREQ